ncbi:MAG: hypothetical protein GC200_12205 [Tepidisphaera sp.]|nr:hypothetical protein [Tepidisphaera sp.]
MPRVLAHPVIRRLCCACPTADEMLLWEWLVEHLDPACFHVEATAMDEAGVTRETELLFVSELDARRFERWALARGFAVVDLPVARPGP